MAVSRNHHAERGVNLSWFMMQPVKEILQLIADLMSEGKLKVELDQILPMEKIAEAHAAIESHSVRGKIVVKIQP